MLCGCLCLRVCVIALLCLCVRVSASSPLYQVNHCAALTKQDAATPQPLPEHRHACLRQSVVIPACAGVKRRQPNPQPGRNRFVRSSVCRSARECAHCCADWYKRKKAYSSPGIHRLFETVPVGDSVLCNTSETGPAALTSGPMRWTS